ncbi:MAG: UDP-N-acetylmuramoyl-L-alanine--D-glutamate ligase [Candidatus Eiseniibacteriota bacterium]|nr:MAG: UDP-N-acetylmuramoyl-L-alanine--D-glutamate ligase [Candidatus Eisenbacteria bacterium]
MKRENISPSFAEKKVLVVGVGRSGMGVCAVLRKYGCNVTATDNRKSTELPRETASLEEQGVKLALGGHDVSLLDSKELVVLSPGVPRSLELIQEALKRKIPVLSEIEVASELARSPLVAVTGTNGKSTVVTLLGKIFADAGFETAVAGNIGLPLSAVVEDVPPDGVIIVEVSSFQLESILRFHPRVAVLLNITHDHLDRYDGMDSYAAAKARIFSNLTSSDFAVVNADDPLVMQLVAPSAARRFNFSFRERKVESGAFIRGGVFWLRRSGSESEVIKETEVRLKGPHNAWNILACICASAVMGVTAKQMTGPIARFKGLEHRLEEVAEIDGVSFVNDSKATNVDALKYALLSFSDPVVLVAGGRDKNGDFASLRQLVEERVRELVLIGEAAGKMQAAWPGTPAHVADSMEKAVETAFKVARPRETVLLAPGCASFDMFKDYEDRGNVFKAAVLSLVHGRTAERTP